MSDWAKNLHRGRTVLYGDIEVRGTRAPSEHTTENTPHGHIVRAVFGRPELNLGGGGGQRQYTYRCLDDVQIGDLIQAPGNSSATVVGLGPFKYKGPIKTARLLRRRAGAAVCAAAAFDNGSAIFTHLTAADYSKDTRMSKFAADYTLTTRIEDAEAELKAARKAAKRAKKLARHKAAIAKENADRRKLALTALEQVAQFDTNGACRIDAALALLERS